MASRTVFIPGNVPSLKNGKIKTKFGMANSKSVNKYLRSHGIQAFSSAKKTIKRYKTRECGFDRYIALVGAAIAESWDYSTPKWPIKVGFHFIRDSHRKFDFNNANQLLADLFTAYKLIPDDNADYFLPFPMEIEDKWYTVDKESAGVIIQILE